MKEEWLRGLKNDSFGNACERCIVLTHKLGSLNEEQTQRMLLEYAQLNPKDNVDSPFPSDSWCIFIGNRGEHFPPHIHIHNIKLNFVCRFDINTCKTIYEEGLTDERSILENRDKRTDNIQNMRGISFEEISDRLKDWYKLRSTKFAYKQKGYSNYFATLTEWNDIYKDSVGECIYSRELDATVPTPLNRDELRNIILDRITLEGSMCDLNDIDISNVKDMATLFYDLDFNGDISKWDVSHVLNMQMMFYNSTFDQDISKWNVNSQCQTYGMFGNCPIKEENKPKIVKFD